MTVMNDRVHVSIFTIPQTEIVNRVVCVIGQEPITQK